MTNEENHAPGEVIPEPGMSEEEWQAKNWPNAEQDVERARARAIEGNEDRTAAAVNREDGNFEVAQSHDSHAEEIEEHAAEKYDDDKEKDEKFLPIGVDNFIKLLEKDDWGGESGVTDNTLYREYLLDNTISSDGFWEKHPGLGVEIVGKLSKSYMGNCRRMAARVAYRLLEYDKQFGFMILQKLLADEDQDVRQDARDTLETILEMDSGTNSLKFPAMVRLLYESELPNTNE